ncbi:MAG: hypothetical protein NBV68_07485 [Erythrobacter sp.]|uniref:hypothetical protein n=1 Tax=Erythrobacter sp. TaxID=1042 RepID=UPI0025E16764|nr:hypothetical protein [Erythrobacter sp.]MCL9999207.1 hypothetical protein [Erythrobacter sp.]
MDAVGEVIGGAIEVAGDVLSELGPDAAAEALDERRRRRRGCWRLFLIVLVVALVVWGVVVFMS